MFSLASAADAIELKAAPAPGLALLHGVQISRQTLQGLEADRRYVLFQLFTVPDREGYWIRGNAESYIGANSRRTGGEKRK